VETIVVVDGNVISAKILAKQEELDEHSILSLGERDFVIILEIFFVGGAGDVQDRDHRLPIPALSEGVFELEFQQQAAGSSKGGHDKA
jgi:hypothetical protein